MPEDTGNTASSNIPDPTAGAKANLRDTVKWLATTLAALAAVILAGTSLTGLARLRGVDLWLALGGGAVAIIAVLLVIALLLRLLISEAFYFGNLSEPAYASVREELDRHAIELLPPSIPNIQALLDVRRQVVERIRSSAPGSNEYAQATDYLLQLREVLAGVTYFAQFEAMRQRLRRDRLPLFGLTLIGLAGLALVVVAVGKGNQTPEPRPPITNIVYPPPAQVASATPALAGEAARNHAIRVLLTEAIRLKETAGSAPGGSSNTTWRPIEDLIHGLSETGLLPTGEANSLIKDLKSNAIGATREILVHLANRVIDRFFPPETTTPAAAPPISITVSGCCVRCRATTARSRRPKKPTRPKKPVTPIKCVSPSKVEAGTPPSKTATP